MNDGDRKANDATPRDNFTRFATQQDIITLQCEQAQQQSISRQQWLNEVDAYNRCAVIQTGQ